jgi:Flp pilus assembly protein TadD
MLNLGDGYRAKVGDFIIAIQDGLETAAAFEKIYGKSMAQVDKDLQSYLRGSTFRAGLFNSRLERTKEDLRAEPAPEFDLSLALADLTNRPGNEAETQSRLAKLSQGNPQRPETWAGLAYLSWRRGDIEEATKNFGKAYDLGDRNPRLLWDYGRLARRNDPEKAIEALQALRDLQPGRVEVRMEIADTLLSRRRAGEAIMTLSEIKNVAPEDAARFFILTAYSQLMLGGVEQARATVERLAGYARTEREQEELQRLRATLERAAVTTAALPPRTAAERVRPAREEQGPEQEEEEKQRTPPRIQAQPRLITRTETVTEYAPPPSVSGTFAEFVCSSQDLKIAIDTSGGRKVFLIEDPSAITIVGRAGGKVDLECGPQQPTPIRVEFGQPSKPAAGVDGAVKVLYFDQ